MLKDRLRIIAFSLVVVQALFSLQPAWGAVEDKPSLPTPLVASTTNCPQILNAKPSIFKRLGRMSRVLRVGWRARDISKVNTLMMRSDRLFSIAINLNDDVLELAESMIREFDDQGGRGKPLPRTMLRLLSILGLVDVDDAKEVLSDPLKLAILNLNRQIIENALNPKASDSGVMADRLDNLFGFLTGYWSFHNEVGRSLLPIFDEQGVGHLNSRKEWGRVLMLSDDQVRERFANSPSVAAKVIEQIRVLKQTEDRYYGNKLAAAITSPFALFAARIASLSEVESPSPPALEK